MCIRDRPHGDSGLTGRKIIVDTYGGKGAHGGGAFSGKDPSKVDRSAAYAARHIAKNIVAAGVADECLVQVSYAIGVAKPMGIFVNTYGSSKVSLSDSELAKIIEEIFDMRPYFIEKRLKLRNPIYTETAAYGHMGRACVKVQKEFKDASDCLSKNKIQAYVKAFWEAKIFAPDGIINANILFDEVAKPITKSFVQYPFEGLNKITYGLRPAELVTFTAGSGLGKTQVMREVVHHIKKSTEDNIGLLMLEETPVITSKGLMSVEANQRLHLPDVHVSKEEMKTYFDATVGTGRVFMFDHFGSNSIDNIVSRVRLLAKGLDCKYVIIDHVSIIVSDQSHGDERRALDEIMTRLRTLVQETGVSMIVVSHLRRPDGKGHEEGAATSLSQLRGSASIGPVSYTHLTLPTKA